LKKLFRACKRLALIARWTAHEVRPWGRGYASAVWRNVRLCRERGYEPFEAFDQGLFRPGMTLEAIDHCLSRVELIPIQRRFNPDCLCEIVRNKALFQQRCLAAELPVPRCELIALRGERSWFNFEGVRLDTEAQKRVALVELLGEEFVIKPLDSAFARGVACLRRAQEGFLDFAGHAVSCETLYQRLRCEERGGWIVQERIHTHPALAELTGCEGLHTMRVKTFVRLDGKAEVWLTFFKLITNPDTISDAYCHGTTGNLWVEVDQERGCFSGEAWGPDGRGGRIQHTHHPLSGKVLNGFEIPFWDEAQALAIRAAEEFGMLRLLSWDIGISPDGPRLIEGNHYWSSYNRSGRMGELRAFE
jgi:hypothetical protein